MTTEISPPSTPAQAPAKRSWLKWVAIGCGLLIVVGICIGVGTCFVVKKATAAPEAAVHEFLAAAGAGDYERAYGYFSAPLKEKQSLESFQQAAQAQATMFKVKDTTFNSRSVDLNGAQLSGTLTLEAGTEVPASFKLVQENGQWRLISYQLGPQ
jgi:hypothetical protein